ncbi:MAG: hypothetical protein K1X28_02355 [Parachlamydiales bacterium]|nr:hypothetical protein [Parachlamydiales bacterium]
MIANMVGRLTLPELTISDEVFGRLYYVAASVIDAAQTVAKIARSIFATTLAMLFLGQSSALNHVSSFSWDDVGFSFQMLGCSLLGILSPRNAWIKKCDLHISNTIAGRQVDFGALITEEWNQSKTFAMRCFLVGQLGESVLRCVTSMARYGIAKAMVALSLNNTRFVDVLADGANHSAESARMETRLISELAFGT